MRNVRPWARTGKENPVDVVIKDGRIAQILPHEGGHASGAESTEDGTTSNHAEDASATHTVDGRGGVLIPALADVHAHLDSTRLGLPFRPHTAGDSLESLIRNDMDNWRDAEQPVNWRATHTLGLIIASGATLVRTHAQIDPEARLDRLHGILEARDTHAGRADVHIVAFPQAGIVRDVAHGTADLLDQALREGADTVGLNNHP